MDNDAIFPPAVARRRVSGARDGTTGPALKTLVVMPQSLSDVASPPSSILRRPASSSRSTTLA